jgi:hypothetical protein
MNTVAFCTSSLSHINDSVSSGQYLKVHKTMVIATLLASTTELANN